jgi:competence protein ComEC
MAIARLQRGVVQSVESIENWLEYERDQLALWVPVMFGLGIGLWFWMDTVQAWIATIAAGIGCAFAGMAAGLKRRTSTALLCGGLCVACGCGMIWFRSEQVAAPRIERPLVARFEARLLDIEAQPERERSRLLVAPATGGGLPPRVRVSVDMDKLPPGLVEGDDVVLRARLVPPPDAAVPGGYDFARTAWFQRIGGTGKALDPVLRLGPERPDGESLRTRISAHVREQLAGSAGGIASAFATGDRGGIAPEDEEAMRASGLTHLLSISGLHITAVVAATMFVTLKILALSPWLALRVPLVLVSAAMGAVAGIGYTLLTGAEVPTIRSCIAALLVLIGLALGREAMTLRLVAAGALVVLLVWPETLVGASFQLSFAAITSIVAFHEHPRIRAATMRRDEGIAARIVREGASLLLTGLVVEIVLAPIALYHFHKSGLYGAAANIVAIPLTTFVVMPFEALALLLDTAGMGAPFWWVAGQGLDFLLWIARTVAALPGAVASLPSVPVPAFGAMLGGGLWVLLWRSRTRYYGLLPIAVGAVAAVTTPAPDLLVTGDGRHLAVRGDDGRVALLRSRTGDYMRDLLAERSGELDPPVDLDTVSAARCGRDMCLISLERGGRAWQVAATRSAYPLSRAALIETCRAVDIVVSARRLPRRCRPRWLKLDKPFLAKSGGLAISLSGPRVETVFKVRDDHPWRRRPDMFNSAATGPPAGPARAPGSAHNAAADRRGWRDRGGSSNPRGGNI